MDERAEQPRQAGRALLVGGTDGVIHALNAGTAMTFGRVDVPTLEGLLKAASQKQRTLQSMIFEPAFLEILGQVAANLQRAGQRVPEHAHALVQQRHAMFTDRLAHRLVLGEQHAQFSDRAKQMHANR